MLTNSTQLFRKAFRPFGILLAIITLFSFGVYVVDYFVDRISFGIPTGSLQVFGIVLSLLLVFRSNQAYDRWWEARKIWGQIVNKSRTWAMQVDSLLSADLFKANYSQEEIKACKQRLVYRHLAYVNVLRKQLRKETDFSEVEKFLSADEYLAMSESKNKATFLNLTQLRDLRLCLNSEESATLVLLELNTTLKELYDCQGMCERIKNTVFPVPYTLITRWVVNFYAVVLPVYLIGEFFISDKSNLDWFAAPLSIIITFTFVMLDRMAVIYKNPFENLVHDTPMTTLCRVIEIDLRQSLGETALPEPLLPQEGVLM